MSSSPDLAPGVPTPGPFSTVLGFRYVGLEDGEAHVEAEPGPEHCNGGGIVHGGYLSSMLDTTTGWAAHSGLAAGSAAPHVQLSVQYVRAAVPGTTLVCRGRVVSAGRRICSTEAEIVQNGRVVARAIASHAVVASGLAVRGDDGA